MSVYFARTGTNGPWVKIGHAIDPQSRVRHLDTGCPVPLVLARVIDGDEAVERWLHKHFAAHRLKGEWFNFVPEMLTIEPPRLVKAPVPQTKLGAWLERHGVSRQAFAEQIGVTAEAVRLYAAGARHPRSAGIIRAIRTATVGEIGANELYDT